MEEAENKIKVEAEDGNSTRGGDAGGETAVANAAASAADAADAAAKTPAAGELKIARVADIDSSGPDVGLFINELKKDSLLPEEIEQALKQARQRIHVDIPEPPADLWDPELEELSHLALPGARPRGLLRAKPAAEEADMDLFAPQHGAEAETLEWGAFVRTQGSQESGAEPIFVAAKNTKAAQEASEASGETEPEDGKSHKDEAAEADGCSDTAEGSGNAEDEKTSPAGSSDEAADETSTQSDKGVPVPPRGGKAKAKKAASTTPTEAKKSRFNPWNLIFGRNNLVDASATLIFMHAGLLFALELLWKQLPFLLPNFNKNGFEAFVLATAAIQGLTLLFPMFLCFNLYKIPSGTILGKIKVGRALVLSSLLLGLPAALFFNGINNIFTYLMISWDVVLPAYVLPTWASASSAQGLLLMVLVGAFLPSILEELFFRGFLQKALYGLKRKRSAIILSALAFAFFHNNPLFFIGPLGAGILLGYLRKNSESIIPAILAHFSMNCSSFFLDPILPRFNTQMVLLFPEEGMSTLFANVVATVASGVVLFFIYRFISANLIRTRAYAGFMTGRRAAVYGRNQTQKARVLDSPDRLYRAPALTWGNYIRLFLALVVWIFSRFLIQ